MIDADGVSLDGLGLSLLWVGLLALFGAVGLGACDQLAGPLVDRQGGSPEEAKQKASLVKPGAVWLVPVQRDERLGRPGESPVVDADSIGTRRRGRSAVPPGLAQMRSAYGCVMSTPNLKGEQPYRYKAVYAFFSKRIMRDAAESEPRLVEFQMNSRRTYASQLRAEAHVLRHARCRIPNSDRAVRLLRSRLQRLPAAPLTNGTPWSGMPASKFRGGIPSGKGPDGKKGPDAKGMECAEYTITYFCTRVCQGDDCFTTCEVESVECSEYVHVDNTDGGGGGDSGDNPDGCNYDGGPSDELCGGETVVPDTTRVRDTSTVHTDQLCPTDPLKDMEIRPTCAGIEGGRYGYTRGPNDNQFHGGLDLSAEKGTDLYAMEGGEVVHNGNGGGFGNYVVVQSAENGKRFFLYAHLNSVAVENNDSVTEGDKLGETGVSGIPEDVCNRAHLHLEVRKGSNTDYGWVKDNGGDTRDPEQYVGTEFNSSGSPISDECG